MNHKGKIEYLLFGICVCIVGVFFLLLVLDLRHNSTCKHPMSKTEERRIRPLQQTLTPQGDWVVDLYPFVVKKI